MPPDPDSRLGLLRSGTRDAHARIETVPAMARLLAPELTVQEYVAVLQRLHAFHAHIEPMLAAELEGLPGAASMLDGARPRALAEDLAWFRAAPVAPPVLDPIDGPAAALGALYVIEGSGLGGRVIARHLGASLGVRAGAGGSFYCRLDADTARQRWANLVRVLETTDLDAPPMVAAARSAFEAMNAWLRRIEAAADAHNAAETAEAVTP